MTVGAGSLNRAVRSRLTYTGTGFAATCLATWGGSILGQWAAAAISLAVVVEVERIVA